MRFEKFGDQIPNETSRSTVEPEPTENGPYFDTKIGPPYWPTHTHTVQCTNQLVSRESLEEKWGEKEKQHHSRIRT